ncbi:PAN/Apple domain-containing protein [Mesorhizobium sp. M0142]
MPEIVPRVSAQEPGEFLDYPETALKGTTSAGFERPLDDCRKICLERSGCVGFDHSSATNICRLFEGIGSAQSDPLSTAGTRQRIPGYPDPVNSESWYYASFSGIDLWGQDIVPKGLAASNAERCSVMCDGHASCRAFTYNQEANRCFLKSGYDFVQSYSGGTSGLYFKAKPSQPALTLSTEWELFMNSDFLGNDLNDWPARSYQECMQQCGSDSQCGGFTYVTRPNRCYLKSGTYLSPVRSSKTRTSARKSERTVYPDFVRPVSPRD